MAGSIQKAPRSRRYHIILYWEGQHHRITHDPVNHEPFFSRERAVYWLTALQSEITALKGSFNIRTWKPQSPLHLEAYSNRWLGYVQKLVDRGERSPNTLKDYRNSVKAIVAYFGPQQDIRRIRKGHIKELYHAIDRTDKGKYNVVSALRTMLNWAFDNEDIHAVPPFPSMGYELPEIVSLTMEQQEKLLNAIPPRHRPIFEFMMETGTRPGEAMALKKDCLTEDEIIIKRAISLNQLRETTKTGRQRKLPLTEHIRSILNRTEKHLGEYVFIRKDGDRYNWRNLYRIWAQAQKKTGIRIRMYNACRHSLGCQLLDQGEDIKTVQQIYGHTNLAMTMRYAKRSQKAIARALDRRRKVVELPQEDAK